VLVVALLYLKGLSRTVASLIDVQTLVRDGLIFLLLLNIID
jgi:hypothetical protein